MVPRINESKTLELSDGGKNSHKRGKNSHIRRNFSQQQKNFHDRRKVVTVGEKF